MAKLKLSTVQTLARLQRLFAAKQQADKSEMSQAGQCHLPPRVWRRHSALLMSRGLYSQDAL